MQSMLISNTIFRLGGAAILLSNKWVDSWRAKYRLVAAVRVHKVNQIQSLRLNHLQGANDKSYNAVFQREDPDGRVGVCLSKELIEVAGDALKSNLTVLGPIILPWSEQIKFFMVYLQMKLEAFMGKE